MKRLLISTVLATTALTVLTYPVSAREWYEGGSLHQASGAQWQRATYENRLATTADFLATLSDRGLLKQKITSMGQLKSKAVVLENAISEASRGGAGKNQSAAELSTLCVILLGWQK